MTPAGLNPGGKVSKRTFDLLNGSRLIGSTDTLGNTTTYAYDVAGYVSDVYDPLGQKTETAKDVRGNTVRTTTCNNGYVLLPCQNTLFEYWPDDTTAVLTPDGRNDQLTLIDAGTTSDDTFSDIVTRPLEQLVSIVRNISTMDTPTQAAVIPYAPAEIAGLVEDILTTLAKLSGLSVIARNSSFTYKGRAVDVRQVARELGVRYVLEGSVRKAANRMRISAQLIDATRRARAEHRRVVLITGPAAIDRLLAVSGADQLLETTTNPMTLD